MEESIPRYFALSSYESAKTLYMSITDIKAISATKNICIARTMKFSEFSEELPEKMRTLLFESTFS